MSYIVAFIVLVLCFIFIHDSFKILGYRYKGLSEGNTATLLTSIIITTYILLYLWLHN